MNNTFNSDFWDSRYSSNEYIYGEKPNEYLVEKLKNIDIGKILLVADGEGRNSVYAAKQGWDTYAFDMSKEGKIKAEKLANKNNVNINYKVDYAQNVDYKKNSFDVLAMIYSHFPADIKFESNKRLAEFIKPGGYIIFELFSKKQIDYQKEYKSGGPGDVHMLYSVEEVKENFKDFEILELKEEEINLNEGEYHKGLGSVIRFFGKKLS